MEQDRLLAPHVSIQSCLSSPQGAVTGSERCSQERIRFSGSSPIRLQSTKSTPTHLEDVYSGDEDFVLTQSQVAALKADVSRNSRDNFDLERVVRQFDTQIGLLINLRIAYDKEQVDRRDFGKLAALGRGQQDKSDSWPSEVQLRNYGTLFFLLQTRPHYIARLSRQVGSSCIDDLLKVIMFTLYGHHYDPREEHLLLCMFELALMQEFEQAADPACLLRHNTAITRMMTSYTRRGPGQEYLHQVLTAPIVFISNLGDNLEIDPVEVYAELVKKGLRSATWKEGFKPSEDEQVKQLVEIRCGRLQEVLETLLGCIFRSASNVPTGIRWLCRTIRTLVHRFFPEDQQPQEQGGPRQDRATSLVGGLFFLRYINPTIVSPSKINIKTSSSRASKRTLTLMAKIIQKIANQTDPNSLREPYMVPFSGFISNYQMMLKDFFDQLCDVDDFHDYMQVEHFLAFTKNSVMADVELGDIHRLHVLLEKHREKIVSDSGGDQLSCILDTLGEPQPGVANECTKATLHLCSRTTLNDDMATIMDADGGMVVDLPVVRDAGHARPADAEQQQQQQLKAFQLRCVTLLSRLFKMLPEIYRNLPLSEVIDYSQASPLQQIKDVGSVAQLLVDKLFQRSIAIEATAEFREMKESLPSQKELHVKYRSELMHLTRIEALVTEHYGFLNEQLETYKVYLAAARIKAVTSRLHENTQSPNRRRRSRFPQPVHVSIPSLRRCNVIIACPAQRNSETVEVAMPSPGQYIFSMTNGSNAPDGAMSQPVDMQLECLLELRASSTPAFILDTNITFDANATITWLRRNM